MKKFEVGKRYKEDQTGTIIEVIKRTEKTITFKHIKPYLYIDDITRAYRKTIKNYNLSYECIELGRHWSEPNINAVEI